MSCIIWWEIDGGNFCSVKVQTAFCFIHQDKSWLAIRRITLDKKLCEKSFWTRASGQWCLCHLFSCLINACSVTLEPHLPDNLFIRLIQAEHVLLPVNSSYAWNTDGTPLHQASGHWPGLVCDLLLLFLFLQPSLARRRVKHSQAEEGTANIRVGSWRQRKRQDLSLTGNKK